jgi:hypothetical protein
MNLGDRSAAGNNSLHGIVQLEVNVTFEDTSKGRVLDKRQDEASCSTDTLLTLGALLTLQTSSWRPFCFDVADAAGNFFLLFSVDR